MSTRPADDGLLARLERYLDAAPRSSAVVEASGPFTLFVSTVMWPYYARPRLGLDRAITTADVTDVRDRQRGMGVPEAFEWVVETTPSLSNAARTTGLVVSEEPLLVLDRALPAVAPTGVRVRRVEVNEPDLARVQAVAPVAFAHGGTAHGPVGAIERDRLAASDDLGTPRLRDRLRSGLTVLFVAEDADGPLATGAHQPVDDVTELVGIATLPAARRRGIGAALTAALVEDAVQRGLGTIFLSASGDDVARIYERLGFAQIGHVGRADPPGDTPSH